ncbi:hypothetical protein DFH28DRAFT_6707 [Melampsora americana]|nr:hypothetical protein DFH28DRAFT_6707 [Melampsora americana]
MTTNRNWKTINQPIQLPTSPSNSLSSNHQSNSNDFSFKLIYDTFINKIRLILLRPIRLLIILIISLSFFAYILIQSHHSNLSLPQRWSIIRSRHLPEYCYNPYQLPGHVGSIQPPQSKSKYEANWIVNNPKPRRRGRDEGKQVGQDFAIKSLFSEFVNGIQYEWLKDKTVILIGDSLDRNLLHFIFNDVLKNSKLTNHRFLTNQTDSRFSEPQTASHRIGIGKHNPLNFVISNWFLMGIDIESEQEFFHPGEDQPQEFESRIKKFYLPLLGTDLLSKTPDLVIFNAGLWDLVYRSELAVYNSKHNSSLSKVIIGEKLTNEELLEHEQRFIKFIKVLNTIFPNRKTKLVYRTMPHSSKDANSNAMSTKRIIQFDSFHLKLIHKLNSLSGAKPIGILDWSSLTHSLSFELKDLVHFNPGKAQWLYAELLFHQLRRIGLGDNHQTEWSDCQEYMNILQSSSHPSSDSD